MTKSEFKKQIKKDENERLAWYDESMLDEMNIQFRTLESILNDGDLVYEPGDDVYVAPKTYSEHWA